MAYTNSQKNTNNMMPIKMTIIPDIYDLLFKFIKKKNKGRLWRNRPIVKGFAKSEGFEVCSLLFYPSAHAGKGLDNCQIFQICRSERLKF